jgi:hypothetical protein
MPYEVKSVLNQDVAGLAERVDEVVYEIARSQSANLTDMRPFDRTRITEYNLMLNRYAAWVTDAPDIDLPETHPRDYPIKYISEDVDADVENKALRDLIRYYRAIITELTNSQSARAANGLTVHDKRRFDLVMEKVDKFLNDYVDNTQPIDMPESAPSSDAVEAGFKGAG